MSCFPGYSHQGELIPYCLVKASESAKVLQNSLKYLNVVSQVVREDFGLFFYETNTKSHHKTILKYLSYSVSTKVTKILAF